MTSNFALPLLLLTACLGGVRPAAAQAGADSAPAVALKLDIVAWGEDIPGLTIPTGGGATEVTALGFRYSKPVVYRGSSILEISQTPGAKNPEIPLPDLGDLKLPPGIEPPTPPQPLPAPKFVPGEAPPAIVARRKQSPNLVALAKLPLNSSRATVFLAPGKGGTFDAMVVDDDPSKLPFGRLRIHNCSPYPIAVRCNEKQTKELKTKDAIVVPPVNGQVVYELAYQRDGAWELQENNLVPIREREQVQLIVLQCDASFFRSSDGSTPGFLQTAVMRRGALETP